MMTDGGLIIGDDGQEYKRFHARDGLGLRMLSNTGIELAIITGRTSVVVEKRAAEIGVNHLFQGRREKRPALEHLLKKTGYGLEQVAYMGDDVVDLSVMTMVGFALSVADGHALVLQHSDWISSVTGGNGAVRDACEMIMYSQGTLDEQFAHHFGHQ